MSSKYSTTILKIVNDTTSDIVNTYVYDTNDEDWARNCGPQNNFVNVFIRSKSSAERQEKVRKRSTCSRFSMRLTYRNGLEDDFRINQKYVCGGKPYYEEFRKSHEIYYQKKGDNTLEITVKSTAQELQNELAEKLNNEASSLINQGKHQEAARKLNQALRSGNQNQIINKINANITRNKNGEAEQLIKIAEDLSNQNKFHEALTNLTEALKLTNKNTIIDAVRTTKAKILNAEAKLIYNDAWAAELDNREDRSQEAMRKFEEAKLKFEQADAVDSKWGSQNYAKLIGLKVEANNLFNEGNELEIAAHKIFEQSKVSNSSVDYDRARSKYQEALIKYKAANERFQKVLKTDGRFYASNQLVKTTVAEVMKIVGEIEQAKLKVDIGGVKFKSAQGPDDINRDDEEIHRNI